MVCWFKRLDIILINYHKIIIDSDLWKSEQLARVDIRTKS